MQRIWIGLFLGWAACGGEPEGPEQAGDLQELSELSDAAFVGTAVEVQQRMSQPSGDTPALPFTFVTYQVEDDLGSGLPERYTLRFLGGTFPDGRTLHGHDVPHIEVGDRDLLFVSRNGESAVPVVRGEKGRFAISGGKVHDHLGTPVLDERQLPMLRETSPAKAVRAVDPDAPFTFEMPGFEGPPEPSPELPMPEDERIERERAGDL